ncbi:sodium-dependent transporter [Natronosalvus caseinilyticus]|uniref:sodium-dependent transporter n=1 Tax=Natronosalvus caseinilyticus TaxID=2953747 RepID=UPI0028B0F324|nr:sodium-dependent transporter [Natronosalvus caseinilyticus]
MVRDTWATRAGFILAAVGSAVGLGNIWRFPFLAGESGGAVFVVVYLALVALIGLPVMLVEFVIGRRSERNPVGAFRRLGHPSWKFAGAIGAVAGFIILSYYSVVGGWVLQYIVASFSGGYTGDTEAFFFQTASGTNAIIYHAIFMALVAGIVSLGVRDGLERAAKLMVPSVIVLLVILAVYAATLPDTGAGYEFYLSPDVDAFATNAVDILPAAAGQAFFTLSLGMGVMITYSSYLGEDRNLLNDSLIIVAIDTFIAILAGLVTFPFLASQGVDLEQGGGGAGAVFISLAAAFETMPMGHLVGGVFFIMLAVAALTSAFSILEMVVSFVVDTFDIARLPATLGLAAIIFVIGIPTGLNLDYLDAYDLFANNILLIAGGLVLSLFIGWVFASDALEELGQGRGGNGGFDTYWINVVKYVVPIALLVTLALAIQEYVEFIQGTFF